MAESEADYWRRWHDTVPLRVEIHPHELEVQPGDIVGFTVSVSNRHDAPARASLEHRYPGVARPGSVAPASRVIELAPGESARYDYVLTASDPAPAGGQAQIFISAHNLDGEGWLGMDDAKIGLGDAYVIFRDAPASRPEPVQGAKATEEPAVPEVEDEEPGNKREETGEAHAPLRIRMPSDELFVHAGEALSFPVEVHNRLDRPVRASLEQRYPGEPAPGQLEPGYQAIELAAGEQAVFSYTLHAAKERPSAEWAQLYVSAHSLESENTKLGIAEARVRFHEEVEAPPETDGTFEAEGPAEDALKMQIEAEIQVQFKSDDSETPDSVEDALPADEATEEDLREPVQIRAVVLDDPTSDAYTPKTTTLDSTREEALAFTENKTEATAHAHESHEDAPRDDRSRDTKQARNQNPREVEKGKLTDLHEADVKPLTKTLPRKVEPALKEILPTPDSLQKEAEAHLQAAENLANPTPAPSKPAKVDAPAPIKEETPAAAKEPAHFWNLAREIVSQFRISLRLTGWLR